MMNDHAPWVIDADGHIVEPDSCFRDFLPAKYSSYVPRVVQFDDHFRYVCGDRISFRIFAFPDITADGSLIVNST